MENVLMKMTNCLLCTGQSNFTTNLNNIEKCSMTALYNDYPVCVSETMYGWMLNNDFFCNERDM